MHFCDYGRIRNDLRILVRTYKSIGVVGGLSRIFKLYKLPREVELQNLLNRKFVLQFGKLKF